MRLRIAILLVALSSCEGDAPVLRVDLRTDLVPGLDFDAIETLALSDVPSRPYRVLDRVLLRADREDDFVTGVPVAELRGVPNDPVVQLSLLRRSAVVAEAFAVWLSTPERAALTIVITRRCRDITCPADGEPEAISCRDGECVDPRCSPETPMFCPPDRCADSVDCEASGCARATCEVGVCFVSPDDTACEAGETCSMESGCRPTVSVDAGVEDAGCVDGQRCNPTECELGTTVCGATGVSCVAIGPLARGEPCSSGRCDGLGDCEITVATASVTAPGTPMALDGRDLATAGATTVIADGTALYVLDADLEVVQMNAGQYFSPRLASDGMSVAVQEGSAEPSVIHVFRADDGWAAPEVVTVASNPRDFFFHDFDGRHLAVVVIPFSGTNRAMIAERADNGSWSAFRTLASEGRLYEALLDGTGGMAAVGSGVVYLGREDDDWALTPRQLAATNSSWPFGCAGPGFFVVAREPLTTWVTDRPVAVGTAAAVTSQVSCGDGVLARTAATLGSVRTEVYRLRDESWVRVAVYPLTATLGVTSERLLAQDYDATIDEGMMSGPVRVYPVPAL